MFQTTQLSNDWIKINCKTIQDRSWPKQRHCIDICVEGMRNIKNCSENPVHVPEFEATTCRTQTSSDTLTVGHLIVLRNG